jgi:hypothetical protein
VEPKSLWVPEESKKEYRIRKIYNGGARRVQKEQEMMRTHSGDFISMPRMTQSSAMSFQTSPQPKSGVLLARNHRSMSRTGHGGAVEPPMTITAPLFVDTVQSTRTPVAANQTFGLMQPLEQVTEQRPKMKVRKMRRPETANTYNRPKVGKMKLRKVADLQATEQD